MKPIYIAAYHQSVFGKLFDGEDVCVGPVATLQEAADLLGTATALPSAAVGQHTERWRGELGLS